MDKKSYISWTLWLVVHPRVSVAIKDKIIVLLNYIWYQSKYKQSLCLFLQEENEIG